VRHHSYWGCFRNFVPGSVGGERYQQGFGGQVAALAMMGWTAPDGIYVPDW
jgi:hypothetical protein